MENKEQEPINEILKRIREMGEKNKEKLPKTKKRFKNMLLSSFKEYVNEENLDKLSEEVIKELEKQKAISLSESGTKIRVEIKNIVILRELNENPHRMATLIRNAKKLFNAIFSLPFLCIYRI